MKYTKTLAFLGLLASIGSANAAITAGSNVVVNFDSASDITDFVNIRDDTPSTATLGTAHNATAGTSGSGAISAVNVGGAGTNQTNDFASLYAPGGINGGAGTIILGVGETLNMTVDFFTLHVNEAATPRFGMISLDDVNAFTSSGLVLDVDGSKDIIGGTQGFADGIGTNLSGGGTKQFNVMEQAQSPAGRLLTPDPLGAVTVTDATWYQFDLNILKSTTANEFNVTVTLNLLDANGAFVSTVSSHGKTVTNSDLYTESGANGVLAGFTFVHDAEPDATTNTYDNLTIGVIVPEPSSIALLGLGGLALILRRKR